MKSFLKIWEPAKGHQRDETNFYACSLDKAGPAVFLDNLEVKPYLTNAPAEGIQFYNCFLRKDKYINEEEKIIFGAVFLLHDQKCGW